MNFENLSQKSSQPEKPKNGISRWIKKNVALAGAVGMGYFGGSNEGMAQNSLKTEKDTSPKNEHKENKAIESNELFEVIEKSGGFTWGVESVGKKAKDGHGFFAQRYVKIDNKSGQVVVIGEFDNVLQAEEEISKLTDIPEKVRNFAKLFSSSIKTERAFEASGFVKSDGNKSGETHIEERTFSGYGIHVKNAVEVDEKGKVVGLTDSTDIVR